MSSENGTTQSTAPKPARTAMRRSTLFTGRPGPFNRVTECNIDTVPQSDHRAVDIKYKITNIKRGPSYWKFNDNLLHDKKFTDQLNDLIHTYNNEYSNENSQIKWELLKITIKEFCIAYCKVKNKNTKNKLSELSNELNALDRHLSKNPLDNESILKRENIKKRNRNN